MNKTQEKIKYKNGKNRDKKDDNKINNKREEGKIGRQEDEKTGKNILQQH